MKMVKTAQLSQRLYVNVDMGYPWEILPIEDVRVRLTLMSALRRQQPEVRTLFARTFMALRRSFPGRDLMVVGIAEQMAFCEFGPNREKESLEVCVIDEKRRSTRSVEKRCYSTKNR